MPLAEAWGLPLEPNSEYGLGRPHNTMTPQLAKICSIRHYCFLKGIIGKRTHDRATDQPPEEDFRQAFRTMNEIYNAVKRHPEATRAMQQRRRR